MRHMEVFDVAFLHDNVPDGMPIIPPSVAEVWAASPEDAAKALVVMMKVRGRDIVIAGVCPVRNTRAIATEKPRQSTVIWHGDTPPPL